jgi:PAS domain S-box-containing protein
MVMRDVTERKKLEGSLRDSEVRYRRLFQTAKDGILILDAESGRIIDANAFMAGLTGQDLNELLGKELHEIGVFKDVSANKAAFKELHDKGYVRYDHLPIQHRGGRTTDVEFVSNVYNEGHRSVAQCNIRDISARVALEHQIQLQTQALADQHRRKDEFLAMLSHELRNPLAPIRSATHLLRLQERGSENLIAKQAREVIERQVAHLTRLISDLLEVSRIVNSRIRLKRETIDLCQAVQHALETAAPLLSRQNHGLTTAFPDPAAEPVWVKADPTRLEQVFVNLLGNAAKYTSKGGHIWVSLEREHNHAVVRVRDSGIGIAPEMLPHIFDLFAQADRSLEHSQGGLGVGLSIVHRLVEMHGGTVEARSEGLRKGSEFIVRLPLTPAPGEMPAPPPRRSQSASTRCACSWSMTTWTVA